MKKCKTIFLFLFVLHVGIFCIEDHLFNELNKNIIEIKKKIDTEKFNPDHYFQLGLWLIQAGQPDEALSCFAKIIDKNPKYQAAVQKTIEILINRADLDQAKDLLAKCPATANWVLNLNAQLNFKIYKFSQAEREWDKILLKEPSHTAAQIGKANCLKIRSQMKEAEELLKKALAVNPKSAEAMIELADIFFRSNQREKAVELCQQAIAIDPFFSRAYTQLSFLFFQQKNFRQSHHYLSYAWKLDPYNLTARIYMGSGFNYYGYPEPQTSPELNKSLKQIQQLLIEKKYKPAEQELYLLENKNWTHPMIDTYLAYILYRQSDFEKGLMRCNRATGKFPNWGIAHFLFSEIIKKKLLGFQDIVKRVRQKSMEQFTAEEPKNLRMVFVNYDMLDNEQKKIILQGIRPFRSYFPELIKKKASHYFLPLFQQLYESSFSHIPGKGSKTFDGRLWDDVKGAGGLNSITGMASLDDALNIQFNTFAHEFAHQIHQYALPAQYTKQIRLLYQQAVKEKRCLDYYAAENEYEYFAQGVEAYVSLVKMPNLIATAGHYRQELITKDPELFLLIAELDHD